LRLKSRQIVLALAFLVILAGGCGRKDTFTSREGGFSVETSSVPKQKKESVPTQNGPVDIHTLTFEMQDPAAEYWVVYIDYPPLTVRQKGAVQLLKEARDGSVNNVRGRLLKERDILVGTYPGKEIEYEGAVPGEEIYRSRICLVRERLYVVLVTVPRKGASERAEQFLDSFRLL